MQKIEIKKEALSAGTVLLESGQGVSILKFAEEGTGFCLPQLMSCKEHLLTFRAEVLEEHSLALNLLVYVHGEEAPAFTVRFGLLPQVETQVCLDLGWLDAQELFPEALAGTLKIVCHGRRVDRAEISKIVLSAMPAFHAVKLKIRDMMLTDTYPAKVELPDQKLVDCFGQSKLGAWKGKTEDLESLQAVLMRQVQETDKGYPFEDWSVYGGWKKKKLKEGTGYFSRIRENGKWWLTDPSGYAYFSMGPDCVGLGVDCRVDGVEKWLDWLPDRDDAVYKNMFFEPKHRKGHRKTRMFSYARANLYKVFGAAWYEQWRKMVSCQLKKYGMNTLGNWSDEGLLGELDIPYVTSLPEFPATAVNIFRDFPDVFSEEYRLEAQRCAQALDARRNDPLMIGYFLRNEPAWAFVDNLVIADEVLHNPARTACKEMLAAYLQKRYQSIEALNRAWNSSLESFDSLYEPQEKVSKWSAAAYEDMKEFSRRMLRAYIEIPVRECRRVDPNHMILGMRWAWISDPDLVTGWENFDVFSINCYAADPTEKIQQVVDLGVDLPVMIGEFHFGALDAGLPATGLEGVKSQRDRGIAYRYYCDRVAAHPNGVGCHYFQCYDQFVLGRFDGENYNIGLFDVCSRPYEEMVGQIRECSSTIYDVAEGSKEPCEEKAEFIPMIAY